MTFALLRETRTSEYRSSLLWSTLAGIARDFFP